MPTVKTGEFLPTRAYADGLLLGSLVATAALRSWILFTSPLRPARPLPWLLLGFAEDLAVLGLVAGGLLVAARRRGWGRSF